MNQAEPVVFVVDDDASVREGLSSLIASVGWRVECFASAQDFLRCPTNRQPSCLILDVRLPGLSGLDLQRELAVSGRHLPIIFITAHGDISMAVHAMKAGAVEFLPKPFRSEDLLEAIRQALEQDRHAIGQRTERALIRERLERLTDRERQVITRISQGKLNKQIAAELHVSENTVKAHRRHIMKKMGATTLPELVLMVVRLA